jgi:hypothetical protein
MGKSNIFESAKGEEEIPQVLFNNFTLFDIGRDSLVETILYGEEGKGLKNGRYIIRQVELQYQNTEFVENVRSDIAFYTDKEIEIAGLVLYTRSDGSSIETNRASYDTVNRYFYIPDKFTFRRNGVVFKGETLLIQRDVGTINAFNIDAVFKNREPEGG